MQLDPGQVNTALSQLTSQATISAVIVYVMEHLKKAKWCTWLTAHTATTNKLVAAGAAAATAVGVHFTFDKTAGALTITGLCLACVLHGAWDWPKSFIAQQLIYDGFVSPNRKLDTAVAAVAPAPAQVPSPGSGA